MSATVIAAFVVACIILALTPGPNMSLLIARTTAHGLRAGLWTLAGTSTGLIVLVGIAALGMSSVMTLVAHWFDAIRWLGAVYLCYLGIQQLRLAFGREPSRASDTPSVAIAQGGQWFTAGLAVSLSNPKVLLFLGAFFPQFLDPAMSAGSQLAVLAVLFVVTLVLTDLSWLLVLARARRSFTARHHRWLDGTAGVMLLAGGAMLATLRRP